MRLIFLILLTYPLWVASATMGVYCWHFGRWGGLPRSLSANVALLEWCLDSWPWYLFVVFSMLGFNRSGLHTWLVRVRDDMRKAMTTERRRLAGILEKIGGDYRRKTGRRLRSVHICIKETREPNAWMLGNDTLIVALGMLDCPDEVLGGVMAHEIGHLHHGDSVKLLDFMLLKKLIVYLFVLPLILFFWAATRLGYADDDGMGVFVLLFIVLFGEALAVVATVLRRLVFADPRESWVAYFSSRICEFRADDFAVELGWGEGLLRFLDSAASYTSEDHSFKEELMRTHPYLSQRRERIQKKLGGRP